ncbi:MAG: LLM class flavin-dependent oxidoreductase [Acidimicrobiales bacterium]
MGMDRAGLTFASLMTLGPDLAVSTARTAAELGYRSFWTAETTGPEAFSLLGAVGTAAPGLDLGTGVLALQLRTPMVVAMAGATLQALAPERDVLLGVGISSPVVTERWHGVPYGDRPLEQVREYVTLLRACLSGEKVDFAGDFYQVKGFRLGVRPRGPGPSGRGSGKRVPKIVVGALNPAMLRLAGELADGVLLNYLPASHVPWSVEQVRNGGAARAAAGAGETSRAAAGAGATARAAAGVEGTCAIYAYVHAGVCARDDGIDLARRDLCSYAVVDSYARNFERAGFVEEVAEIRERFAAGDREGALGAVSDRMVDAIDAMGDADAVHATMQSYVDAGVEVPVLMPLPWGRDRRASADATIRAAIGKG